jgi:hypothetical protein
MLTDLWLHNGQSQTPTCVSAIRKTNMHNTSLDKVMNYIAKSETIIFNLKLEKFWKLGSITKGVGVTQRERVKRPINYSPDIKKWQMRVERGDSCLVGCVALTPTASPLLSTTVPCCWNNWHFTHCPTALCHSYLPRTYKFTIYCHYNYTKRWMI